MIGLKSVAAVAIGAGLVALAAWRGALAAASLASLGGTACFVIGAVASLALGLVTTGWRPEVKSRGAIALRRARLVIVDDAGQGSSPRELPATAQRLLLLAGFASVALLAIGNHAAARITALPAQLASPSPSQYCLPVAAHAEAAAPAPPPVTVDQPGCALVKRAFQLGYAKSLGACAPKTIAAAAPAVTARREVCTRRQLDEPFLHYGYRRVAGAIGAATDTDPIDALARRAHDVRAHLDYLDGLLADIRHAITGSPHAAHHLWVNLPDPHRGGVSARLLEHLVGAPRCSTRFASLPLWPRWGDGDGARVVEHVLGQLLFATRFGTTASCNDYRIHWDAPADACARLAADPIGFLGSGDAGDGALAGIRAVLDRRRRQVELAGLAAVLGRAPPAAPPPVSAVVSLQCLVIDPGASAGRVAPTGSSVTIDGDAVGVREVRVPAVRTEGDGPIDVYVALAALLGGGAAAAVPASPLAMAPPRPEELDGDDFLLTRLDPLIDADPFAGVRWPLARAALLDVFPFERHLHGFIDGFRRRYLAQRGRL